MMNFGGKKHLCELSAYFANKVITKFKIYRLLLCCDGTLRSKNALS